MTHMTRAILVDGVRLGYATNSSSSHSLIFTVRPFSEEHWVSDTSKELLRELEESRSLDFGWQWFEYYKPIGKLLYGYAQVARSLTKSQRRRLLSEHKDLLDAHGLSVEQLASVTRNPWDDEPYDPWGEEPTKSEPARARGRVHVAIDHQSQMTFPSRRVRGRSGHVKLALDFGFVRQFLRTLVYSPYIAVWGGHDNFTYENERVGRQLHPYARYLTESFLTGYSGYDCCVTKPVTERGDAYALFMPDKDGLKFRFRFIEDAPFEGVMVGERRLHSDGTDALQHELVSSPWKLLGGAFDPRTEYPFLAFGERLVSDTPELIDLKITDYCPFGCSFCYQGSTTDGKHADFGSIERFADLCFRLGVFEVAIGGGEPTLHPRFLEILELFAQRGILAHFTTKNAKFLRDRAALLQAFRFSGSVAYSLDPTSEKDWSNLEWAVAAFQQTLSPHSALRTTFADRTLSLPHRLYVHLVMGTFTREQYRETLERLYRLARSLEWVIPITLLGFKRIGRGAGYQPIDYRDWWLEETMGFYHRDAIEMKQDPSFRWLDQRSYRVPLGIDTALARESDGFLKAYGVPNVLYEVEEGRHNAYYDATTGRLSLASYEPYLFRAQALSDRSLNPRAFKRAYHALQRLEGYRR